MADNASRFVRTRAGPERSRVSWRSASHGRSAWTQDSAPGRCRAVLPTDSTAKYRPEFPAEGFASLDEARAWAADFVRWYNVDHRHSGIRYVSPQQRHDGQDKAILDARHALYLQAPQR